MLTALQYRILRRIAPAGASRMTGAAYASASKLQILLGADLLERVRGKDVLDFGCGYGVEAVEMAHVARSVFGLDILPKSLERGRELAQQEGVADRCTFGTIPPVDRVDTIISLDSFEHFGRPDDILRTMHELLRPGGQVIASFGPTWYHPLGGHLFSVFPWAHLVFSERALVRWRSDIRADGATRLSEVDGGLNQMTIGRFERLVAASPLRLVHLQAVPIRQVRAIAHRFTPEFTPSILRGLLARAAREEANGGSR